MVTKKEQKKKEKIEEKKRFKVWVDKVKENYNRQCAFCGKEKYLNAHHIIPRDVKGFRFMEINGMALCPAHHKWGLKSAHKNPLWFFIKLEKYFPLKYKVLKKKYEDYLKYEENGKPRQL